MSQPTQRGPGAPWTPGPVGGRPGMPPNGHGPGMPRQAMPYPTVPHPRMPHPTMQAPPLPDFGSWGPPPPQPPPPARRPRRKWPIFTALIAVLALGAGAVFAFNVLFRGGGASTSGEVVKLLAADLQSGSQLGALSRLHPGERALVVDMQTTLGNELKRLEIIRPDADLTAATATVAGLTFDEAAAEPVRDDVVITKLVGGTISLADDKSRQIFTDEFAAIAFRDGVVPGGAPTTIDIAKDVPGGIRIATVRVDGSWYVSALYTAADYYLHETGTPWPKTSVPARGAASATDALKQTVQAALDGDVRRLIELAPPSELQVLHDIGDVLATTAGTPSGMRLIDLQTTESAAPGGTALQVQKVVLEDPRGRTTTVSRDGDCLVAQVGDAPGERACSFADFAGGSGATGSPALDRVLPKLFAVVTNPKIVVVQDAGAHYVSPFRTLTAFYGDALRALDPQDVRDLLELGTSQS